MAILASFPTKIWNLWWFYQAKDVCCFSNKHGDWTKTCNRFTNNKRDLTHPKWTGIASQQAENLKESTGLLSSQFRPTQPFQVSSRWLQLKPSSNSVWMSWIQVRTSPLSGHGVHGRGTRVEQAKASGHRAVLVVPRCWVFNGTRF